MPLDNKVSDLDVTAAYRQIRITCETNVITRIGLRKST
jgi:hypothetical protein